MVMRVVRSVELATPAVNRVTRVIKIVHLSIAASLNVAAQVPVTVKRIILVVPDV